MFSGNVKMALAALRSSKWRSLLTMLGVIIGIVSVVTTVSLGEGVKQQVLNQINQFGNDLITIRPGKTIDRDLRGAISGVNILSGVGSSTLTEEDVAAVQKVSGVRIAVPVSSISGVPRVDNREFTSGFILGTTEAMPEILNQKVEFGTFFNNEETNRRVAVIGRRVAEQLFQENVPVGKSFTIRGQEFIVRGIFEEFEGNPFTPNTDFDVAIFIPYQTGKDLTGGNVQIAQILAKPVDPNQAKEVVETVKLRLLDAHAGEEDFTVLKQDENLAVTNNVVNLFTGFIAGIAAISLMVGGIGIMNIMLVSVTERTREIGIRKAVGAANRQILGQFLVEAMVLSSVGGIIGVLLSVLANVLFRIFTDLKPIVSLRVVLLATVVSLIVGVLFGIMPALKAARKDPIEALRYE